MPGEDKEIVFGNKGLDPDEEAAYREQIKNARNKGVNAFKDPTPLGGIPRPAIPLMERHGVETAVSPFSETGGIQPRPAGAPLLRPETAKQVQEMAAAAQAAQEAEEKKAEDQGEKKEEAKSEEDLFEMFDFERRNEAERVLNNKKRRVAIESRCEPMSLQDLIMKDEVRQLVPIVPKEFEVIFRSMTPDENLFIKRYLALHDKGETQEYLVEKFGLLQLVCSLVSINGNELPSHLDSKGDIVTDAFDVRLKTLLKKSGYVIADLGLNYYWFDIRVRKLINPDALGNG